MQRFACSVLFPKVASPNGCLVLSAQHFVIRTATKRAYLVQCFKFDDEFDDVLVLTKKKGPQVSDGLETES
jgi:hypothetical protein